MRLVRLTYLARNSPGLLATVELTRAEIRATIALRQPRGVSERDVPPIGDVVRWIADLGGYTGRSSGGPPGFIVIARGLNEIRPVARLMERRCRWTEQMRSMVRMVTRVHPIGGSPPAWCRRGQSETQHEPRIRPREPGN